MSEASATAAKTPWHLWLVGGIGILWNGFGAHDYTMTQSGGEAYLRSLGMIDVQISWTNSGRSSTSM